MGDDAGTALTAEIDDARVASVLRRAVQVIDPVIDGLTRTDPFGLRGRTRIVETSDGPFGRALDSVGWALNAADVPGTRAWDDKDLDGRVDWWVRRVGALNTVWVASLQHLAGLLRAIDAELDKRPHPRSFYRFLGMLPIVGAVAEYFGEYGALVRAAKKGRAWIGQHPAVIRAPEGTPR